MWHLKKNIVSQGCGYSSTKIALARSIGTSTHDGLGIAFAVCEELIHTRAFVLFATHFQDLASSLTVYHNVVNLHLETEVKNTNRLYPAKLERQHLSYLSAFDFSCQIMDGERDAPGIIYKYHITDGSAKEEHYGKSFVNRCIERVWSMSAYASADL